WHAGIHQSEEEQRDLRGILPPDLELTQRILRVGTCIDEKPRIARRVRQEWHDRHERERGMPTAPEQAKPRGAPGAEQIRPKAAAAYPSPPGCDADRSRQNDATGEMNLSQWVEQCENQKPKRVGDDPQKGQEGKHGMRRKDDSSDEIAESKIRGEGDWPAEG